MFDPVPEAPVTSPTELPELLPSESNALIVALTLLLHGDDPPPLISAMCVLALARLMGLHDWTQDD